MAHDHGHGHSHAPANYGRAFLLGVILNLGFVIVETIFGLLSNSLALVADAGHNLSDVLALLLAWGASILVRRRPTRRYTYGLRRSSILAALANAVLLLVAVGAIAWESIQRLGKPGHIDGETVIWVAAVGIVINGATAFMFMSGRKEDLNIKGAFLHMVADALVSLGVVIAGAVILFTGWEWLDPVISLIIVAIILISTWELLRDSINLALDAVPAGIDIAGITNYLLSLPDVSEVHDLHIWGMSTTETALTAHLVIPNGVDTDALIARATEELHDRFKIEHTTLQIEHSDLANICTYCTPVDPVRNELKVEG